MELVLAMAVIISVIKMFLECECMVTGSFSPDPNIVVLSTRKLNASVTMHHIHKPGVLKVLF